MGRAAHHWRMRALLLALTLMPTAALANCPPPAESADATAELLTDLLQAPDEMAANAAASGLWSIWLTAPDEAAQEMLDTAIERRESYDFAMSEAILDRLIGYCPTYIEGFNQRAFTRFLRDDYDGALADIDIVLRNRPYHFGALSGKAMTLMRQGRVELAQDALRQAVKVHPWLRERAMLVPAPESDL